jgi:hypothetical protein
MNKQVPDWVLRESKEYGCQSTVSTESRSMGPLWKVGIFDPVFTDGISFLNDEFIAFLWDMAF